MVGIQDKELSRKLQLIPNLTLEMMVQETCQLEEVKAQVSQQGDSQNIRNGGNNIKGKDRVSKGKDRSRACGRCSKAMHKRDEKCSAPNTTCHRCKKNGHWEKMCKKPNWWMKPQSVKGMQPIFWAQ